MATKHCLSVALLAASTRTDAQSICINRSRARGLLFKDLR